MNIIDDIKFQYKIGGIANKMIYWNVGIFLLSIIFFYQFNLGSFSYPNWLAISSDPSTMVTMPWTLLTYAFFHYGFLNNLSILDLLFNEGRYALEYLKKQRL